MLLVNFIDSVSSGYPNTEKKADVQCSIFDKIPGIWLVDETLAFSSFLYKNYNKTEQKRN